ncbi:MAG: 50S ribosomal protein L9 [Acidobacteriaceae bacterium]
MEVILKEDVSALGNAGEVVKVANGYGRNYLLPKRLAIEATASNRAVIEQMKAAVARRTAGEKQQAEALLNQLDSVSLEFFRKAGKEDHIFGSVTSADIAQELESKGFNIDRRKLQMPMEEPLKTLGEFLVPVKLHREVTAHVKVEVKREGGDEAEA